MIAMHIRYQYTDGSNDNFKYICGFLDDYLNDLAGGEENRKEYIPHNTIENIHDVIIAYDGLNPIGAAAFRYYSDDTAEVKRVFIKDEYRGRGLSKNLMDLLEEKAKEKGFTRFILETGKPLVAAMHLYKSLSFTVIENYGPYKDLAESVCMEKIF